MKNDDTKSVANGLQTIRPKKCRIIKSGEKFKAQCLEMKFFSGRHTRQKLVWNTLKNPAGEDILCHTESEAEAMLRDYANRTRKSEDSVVKEFEV